MIYEICMVIAVIGFIVWVSFTIAILISINKTIEKAVNTIVVIGKNAGPISVEADLILKKWNTLTNMFSEHLQAFTPLFNSIHHLGKWLENSSESLNTNNCSTLKPENLNKRNKQIVAATVELVAKTILPWKEIKRRSV